MSVTKGSKLRAESIRYKSVPFPLRLHWYSFGAVQVQNCSSFLVGTKLYLIAGTKLYGTNLSSVNARLIRNTFYWIKK